MSTATTYKLIGGKPLDANGEPEGAMEIREAMKDNCVQMSRCCSVVIGTVVAFIIIFNISQSEICSYTSVVSGMR